MGGINGWLKNKLKLRTTLLLFVLIPNAVFAQWNWQQMDTAYGELPPSMHVYRTQDPVSGKPNVAFYVVADLQDSQLDFRSDTSYKRRLTPFQFQEKLQAPYLVVNTSFFSFTTHQNLNMMMDRGVMTAYNVHSIPAKGKDSLKFRHPLVATLGITSNRKADVAWTFTDSSASLPWASQLPMPFLMNESKKDGMELSMNIDDKNMVMGEGRKKTGTKLCARGKAAAKAKYDVYPSAYANGFAIQVCKGKIKGLDGQKRCSGTYC